MKFENLPPLNKKHLDHFKNEAAKLAEPGGAVAFHVDGVFVLGAVKIAGNHCRVASWTAQGPITKDEVRSEMLPQIDNARSVSIN